LCHPDDVPQCQCETPGDVRPNIVLYNDNEWNMDLQDKQEENFQKFAKKVEDSHEFLIFLEIGINP